MSIVAPPDMDAAVTTYLRPLMPVPVVTRIPNPRPESLVRVSATGGIVANVAMASVTVLVEAWAPRKGDASDLAREAWKALRAADGEFLDGDVWASHVRLSVPIDFPDETSPRFQFTADMTVTMTS